MQVVRVVIAVSAICVIAACSSGENANSDSVSNSVAQTSDEGTKPTPNYHDVDGSTYIYQAGLSDDDRNAGKATGDLLFYRYRGQLNEKNVIEILNASDRAVGTAECGSPCKIITIKTQGEATDRIAYDPQSVIGSAFQDIANGYLKVAEQTGKRKSS